MSRFPHLGPHELGQNFLTDRRTIARIVQLAGQTSGPLVEWGTGDGSVTVPLSRLGRPIEGVEIDAVRAQHLRRRVGPHVCISEGDILRHAPPAGSTVVSNVPFSLTTPVLRHLLSSPNWDRAVLLVQWEVAKKRAGIGGATQLTAQWWPWFSFTLDRRVPASAFHPRPAVDGGILVLDRLERPLLATRQRRRYQSWVRQVFASGGRGLADILARTGRMTRVEATQICRDQGLDPRALPRDLTVQQWVAVFVRSAPGSEPTFRRPVTRAR
jgi:23S rRNA (adenine-N6)-dimethyltransferase